MNFSARERRAIAMSMLAAPLAGVSIANASPGRFCRAWQLNQEIDAPSEASVDTLDQGTIERAKLCGIAPVEGLTGLDLMQLRVYQTVCSTAAWFDSFFGDLRAEQEDDRHGAHGRIGIGAIWDQADSLEIDTTFRVHFPLPRAERRMRAFLGRVESDQFIDDVSGGFETVPLAFRELEDEEWLLGLGYRGAGGARSSFGASVGLNFRTPIEPFIKTSYRVYSRLGERSLGRFRETVFWRKLKGYGATSRFDLERLIGDRFLLRWVNAGTISEADRGLAWYSQTTLYSNVGEGKALAIQTGISGETDAIVRIRDVVCRAIYRQSTKREWLFGEVRLGIHWPRENFNVEREPAVVVGVGMEMRFEKSFVELRGQR